VTILLLLLLVGRALFLSSSFSLLAAGFLAGNLSDLANALLSLPLDTNRISHAFPRLF
jgi:hypothetical protein